MSAVTASTYDSTWPSTRENHLLSRIFMIAERMIVFDGLDDVFEHIVKTAVTLTHAEAATIRVFNIETGTLDIVKGYGLTDGFLSQPAVRVGEGITGRVVQSGQPFTTINVQQVPDVKNAEFAQLEGIRSLLCVPMNTRDSTIGCITVYRKNGQAFADHDLLLLSIFASEAVEAVEKARLINELKRQATLDSLTGLYNKRSLMDKLTVEMARSQRHQTPMAVMFVDLDGFKVFNDAHGHLMGDKLLHDFTRILRKQCRKIDVVGRFGGDEFIILAPQTQSDGAVALAEKILHELNAHSFITSKLNEPARITCSIGIAVTPDHGLSTDEVLVNADRALYASKRNGRNLFTVWNSELGD